MLVVSYHKLDLIISYNSTSIRVRVYYNTNPVRRCLPCERDIPQARRSRVWDYRTRLVSYKDLDGLNVKSEVIVEIIMKKLKALLSYDYLYIIKKHSFRFMFENYYKTI